MYKKINLLGLKWVIPTLVIINTKGHIRFNELKKSLDKITSARLSGTLKKWKVTDLL